MNFLVNTEENLYCDYTVNDKTVPSHHPSSGQDCDIYGRIYLLINFSPGAPYQDRLYLFGLF